MKGFLTIITPAGDFLPLPPLSKRPPVELFKNLVGGDIEHVPMFKKFNDTKCVAIANEDGKRLNLEPNEAATALWREQLPSELGDTLVGSIVIVQGDEEFMGEL